MNKIIGILFALAILGVGTGLYLYNKPHANMAGMKADYRVQAADLFQSFHADEAKANATYLDKVIEISGTVLEVTEDEEGRLSILFDSGEALSGVICQMDKLEPQNAKRIQPGENITLKGICTGMLMDVILVRCISVS